tara:strand:+ start:105678 stop:106310 length:633 start_codon:yes stop_codon:yes gene_type:complete
MVSIASSLPAASQDIVFQDSFERKQLGDDWLVILPSFTIRDGRLLGHEEPERGHGAVCRAPVEFQNGKFEFSFRLTDGQSFNFVVNDKNCKEVHAGHICRVSISAKLVRISDDREGAMRNDLFAALRDPKQNLDRRKVLKDREILIPNTLAADQWHHVSISIVDDQMSVTIDGKQIGQLKSPGIAHATKTDFGFTVVGNEIEFDDVRMSR